LRDYTGRLQHTGDSPCPALETQQALTQSVTAAGRRLAGCSSCLSACSSPAADSLGWQVHRHHHLRGGHRPAGHLVASARCWRPAPAEPATLDPKPPAVCEPRTGVRGETVDLGWVQDGGPKSDGVMQ